MKLTIYDPLFEGTDEPAESFVHFVRIIRQLRRDCPWDKEQTHDSVKHLLIEEAYETLEAIDRKDWDELKRELGDILLHVVFHSVMAEEDGSFSLGDVIETEAEKLIRRHPHVFSDITVQGVNDVLANWEQIKMKEGKRKSILQGVPGRLPALLRAQRVQEKAAGVGFDFPERNEAWSKVVEEIEEFRHIVDSGAGTTEREAEFGDLLFALVNYARFIGINSENALRRTNEKFAGRVRFIEQKLAESGRTMSEAGLAEMDAYWEEAKRHEE